MKMKRTLCSTLLLMLVLLNSVIAVSLPPPELSTMALVELNELLDDISAEQKLHYEVDSKEKEAVFSIVKDKAEKHYADQGIVISWAWVRYDYAKNRDLYTLATHLDYKDAEGKGQKRQVLAELFPNEEGLALVYLQIGDHEIINKRGHLPANLLMDGSQRTVNERTGLNLSTFGKGELDELKRFVKDEINENHSPKGSVQGKVHELVRSRVEAHYSEQGISVSWPWFDYSYTNDWGCYTETTRISYMDEDDKKQDRSIYAEVFPENDVYDVYFLKIGDEIVFDYRSQLTSLACLQFLNSRDYLSARELEQAGKDEEALKIWQSLGDFADSAKRFTALQDKVNKRRYTIATQLMASKKYKDAVLAFEELGGYLDSTEKLQAAKTAILDRDYQAAKQLMKGGHFESAILAFEALGSYSDSLEQIAACKLAIQDRSYQAATQLMEEGQYENAMSAFLALGDYLDSTEQVRASEIAIKDRAYALASAFIHGFQYEQATQAFRELDGYLDSQEKIAFCETALNSIDRVFELPQNEISLYIKQNNSIKPVVTPVSPEAPKKTTVVFSSSDDQVVKVGKNGTITGKGAGEAFITYVAEDNPYVGGRLLVRVLIPVSRLTMNMQKLDLQISSVNSDLGNGQLSVTAMPEDASSVTIEWSSSNEKVATVDQEGRVHAIGMGQARITATSRDTAGAPIKAVCTVNVTHAVESIAIVNANEPIYVGKTTSLKTEVLPKQAANKKLTWTSSDTYIATVSSDGKVKGVAPGKVTITATSASGVSVKLQVNVEVPPTILRVTGSARLIARNHVGHRWTKEFRVDDIDFTSSTKISVRLGQSVKVFCWITENDKYPETGMLSETIEITEEIMKKGITIRDIVYVTENNGRYSGYSAEWEVTIRIGP